MFGADNIDTWAKQHLKTNLFRLSLVTLVMAIPCFTVGCASDRSGAPVVAVAPKTAVTRGVHTVQQGESLYLIAWRYGRDYKELAVANGLDEPYQIRPGERISLAPATALQLKAHNKKQQRKARVSTPRVVSTKRSVEKTPSPSVLASNWVWPTKGEIVSKFKQKPKPNKGIDIANQRGTPIKATQAGKVVYSGQGLRGYGRLLIIKHDDEFLSAYAHNDTLLVKEGHYVQQNQTIATMGQSDAKSVKLHFEIRKNGQPVDPLSFLPNPSS